MKKRALQISFPTVLFHKGVLMSVTSGFTPQYVTRMTDACQILFPTRENVSITRACRYGRNGCTRFRFTAVQVFPVVARRFLARLGPSTYYDYSLCRLFTYEEGSFYVSCPAQSSVLRSLGSKLICRAKL